MGSWYWKRVRASSMSCKFSKVEGGSYAPMSWVSFSSVVTLQLTTFGLWRCVNYMLQPWGRSRNTRPNPPCASPAVAVIINKHTTSYTSLFYNNPSQWSWSTSELLVQRCRYVLPGWPAQYWIPVRCGCWRSWGIVPWGATSIGVVVVVPC